MPSLGPAEILVILVVALLVFGPNKMPEMAKQAGRAFRELRRVQQHLRSEISGVMSDLDVGNAASTTAPEASDVMGGGDPVPMLPPREPAPPVSAGGDGADVPVPSPSSATPSSTPSSTPSAPPPVDPA